MKSLAILMIMSMPVQANGIDLLPLYENAKPAPALVHTVKHKTKTKAKKKPKKSYSFRPSPPVEKPSLATDAVTRCIAPVRVVGSQDIREDAAEESAKKAWSEQVRWASGEAYMDMQNASDYQKRCSRSSIGEALGAVLNRCEIIATPCRPGMVNGGAQ